MTRAKPVLRRYVAGDVNLITPRGEFAAEADAVDARLRAGGRPPGQAWTVQLRGEPIGCGGLFEAWPGRWIAWTWIGDVPFSARAFVALSCRHAIEAAIAEHGARRIEAHARWDVPWARRFLERLGFALEGRAVGFGPDGADYASYALIAGVTHGR